MTLHIPRAARIAALVGVHALLLTGCAHRPPRFDLGRFDDMPQCAEARAQGIGIAAMALPIAIPPDIAPKGARDTRGLMARRVSVTFAPGSIKPDERLLWNRLNLRSFGGTIEGWTRLRSEGVLIELVPPATPAAGVKPHATHEQAAVAVDPGYLIVSRVAPAAAAIASDLTVDILVLPGGMTIDESVVRIAQLWAPDGKPLPADSLDIELIPVSHGPGYDLIEATVAMDYALQDNDGAVCRGAADTRIVLADPAAVRPALWDVGTSALNGPRNRWLAFRSPATGVFRALFDSPESATSFAKWIEATHATRAGRLTLGLFERSGREFLRPLVPVDRDANETFRELSPQQSQPLRTGPLGEP